MPYKDLVIVNNEKIFKEEDNFYCDNLDLKVLPEELNSYYKVHYLARKAKRKGGQKVNLNNIKISTNIFNLIYFVFKTLRIQDARFLLISITPFTFIAYIILFLFRKKTFIYLFSDGHEEYKYILGPWFVWIYHFMYLIVTWGSEVIVCHERLFNKKKSHLVYISRLNDLWLKNQKKATLDKIKLLYVGRMSSEKGIFDFLKMFDQLKFQALLSIVGNSENEKILNKNVKLLGYISDVKSLINVYDEHNIMILPSYTEATPYVVDESLSRRRPVIIFEDISYIVRNKIGIFVSKRDIHSLSKTIKYVMDNYIEIQKNMEKNILPTKKDMIKQISDIIEIQTSKK